MLVAKRPDSNNFLFNINRFEQMEKDKVEALEKVATLEKKLLEVQEEKEQLIKILAHYRKLEA